MEEDASGGSGFKSCVYSRAVVRADGNPPVSPTRKHPEQS